MISAFFFISGFCGILYQIVWLRLAMGYFGVIAPVLSTVLSIFMLGLGFGSWAAGRWLVTARAARFPAAYLLALYGGWEALAVFGAVSVPVLFSTFNQWLSGEMPSRLYLLGSALGIAGTLVVPCIALGATIPTALAYARARGWDVQRGFSWLYMCNVAGALFSALLTPFVLIECLGFRKTLSCGLFLQSIVAAAALLASLRLQNKQQTAPLIVADFPGTEGLRSAKISLAALFSTGFVSMACEVIWTRLFTPILGTTIYAFAGILAVYLALHAAGAAAYRRWGKGVSADWSYRLLAVLPVAVLLPLFLNDARWSLSPLRALGSLFLFCALLGWLTPGWVDAYSAGDPRRAGSAYGINVLGCVIGPLVAGYLLLPMIGVKSGLILLAAFLGVLALWTRRGPFEKSFMIVSLLGTAPIFAALASRSLEVPPSKSHAVIRRDYAATVISIGEGMDKALFVNGINLTNLTAITKMMAHLPVLAHAKTPKKALMICFGMGTTYRSLLSWNLDTTAVELVPSVRDAFGYYFADAPEVLRRPEGRIVIDDGRRFLRRTSQRFDIITLDPPPPVESAASGLLYSREFYEEIKNHLELDGVVQQWWPGGEIKILQSVARTFFESFPYVRVYKGMGIRGFHLLGSRVPMRALSARDRSRMTPAAQKDMLEWFPGASADDIFKMVFQTQIPPQALLDASVPSLTDDRPYNEYFLLRRGRLAYPADSPLNID